MKIIEIFFDSLFPPRQSELLVREVTSESLDRRYQPHLKTECICLSEYRDPLIQALITENKFYNNAAAKRALATLLKKFTHARSDSLILIPVPLGSKRLRDRGYNQVSEVLQQLQNASHVQIYENICARKRETLPQVSLQREARLRNMTDAFEVNKAVLSELREKTLVIIDDVCTTGATMQALRSAFLPHLHPSCTIICLALAH